MITTSEIIEIISQLPDATPKLFNLVWQIIGKDGKPDPVKICFLNQEIDEAIQKALDYSRSVKEINRCLINQLLSK